MFVKNDLSMDKIFQRKNGSHKISSSQEILVHFPEEDKTIEVENTNGRIFDIKSILQHREEVLGTFVHYPIKLAWAITVHKARIDFDKAAIDVSQVLCQVRLMLHYRVCAR
jgi:phosphoribosylformylglycinamidine (FGAM) synthase-like amidotransferase family enzyme